MLGPFPQAAFVLAKRFVDARCSAVLTAEMSGVAPAAALARKLRVPLVCARGTQGTIGETVGETFSLETYEETHEKTGGKILEMIKKHVESGKQIETLMTFSIPPSEARRELSEVMKVSGGTISAKVEGSTDLARGMLHIFKETQIQRWFCETRGNQCSLPRERIQWKPAFACVAVSGVLQKLTIAAKRAGREK